MHENDQPVTPNTPHPPHYTQRTTSSIRLYGKITRSFPHLASSSISPHQAPELDGKCLDRSSGKPQFLPCAQARSYFPSAAAPSTLPIPPASTPYRSLSRPPHTAPSHPAHIAPSHPSNPPTPPHPLHTDPLRAHSCSPPTLVWQVLTADPNMAGAHRRPTLRLPLFLSPATLATIPAQTRPPSAATRPTVSLTDAAVAATAARVPQGIRRCNQRSDVESERCVSWS